MSRVTVSRPDSEDRRKVLVDGRHVATIHPDMSGCSTSRGRRPWFVTAVDQDEFGVNRVWRGVRLSDALDFVRDFAGWPVTRWVAMSGDHGCLPDYTGCCDSRENALESLRELFGFGGRIARVLARDGYTRLPGGSGAEYCEVLPCACPVCTGCTIGNVDDWECEDCSD